MNALGLAVAFAVAAAAIALLRRTPATRLLADHPNERSLHTEPTPRVGGLGLLAGAAPIAALFAPGEGALLIALSVGLAVVSVMDDARSLPVAVRLAFHFGAAVCAAVVIHAADGFGSPAMVLSMALGVLATAWMANLFNFMDGSDGLAGGMAVIGFATLAVAAGRAGASDIAMMAAAIAAASVAFLAFNFPPARVFLGDAGSVPIGFLGAAIGWLGAARNAWPWWFPILVFSPFIVDATLTLARRLAAGEPIWRAHRSHYYQRLVLGGWSHRRLALNAWLLMLAVSASALVAREGSEGVRGAIIAAWVVAYGALAVGIDRRHPRRRS